MSNNRDLAKCYIGRCKCGAVVAATVIDCDGLTPEQQREHDKNIRKDVAVFMRSGLTIEQMTVAEVRKAFDSHCTCPKPKKPKKTTAPQGSLPL